MNKGEARDIYNKKGISATVAVVLIILITIAAVGIVWTVALPIIKEGVSEEKLDAGLSIETEGGYTYFDESSSVACVQVRRTKDKGELSGIGVKFSFEGTSYEGRFESENIPKVNEARTQCFNLSDFAEYGAPESISVVPIFNRDGREIVSDIVSSVLGAKIKRGGYDRGNGGGGGRDAAPVNRCADGEIWDGAACVDWILIDDCRVLDIEGGKYRLINGIVNDSTCFTVSANDVTLDFDGFSITGDSNVGPSDYGIYVEGYDGMIIDNGTIEGFYNGIYLMNSNGAIIKDLVVTSDLGEALILNSSSNNLLENLYVEGGDHHRAGIFINLNSDGNELVNIIATSSDPGIRIDDSSGNNLTNIAVLGNILGNGISLFRSSNNTLKNVNANSNGFNGITITHGRNNKLMNVSVNKNKYSGLTINGDSTGNNLTNVVSCNQTNYYGKDLRCTEGGNFGTGNVFGEEKVVGCSDGWPVLDVDYVDC
jgi:parallel beta-helix repeat protein